MDDCHFQLHHKIEEKKNKQTNKPGTKCFFFLVDSCHFATSQRKKKFWLNQCYFFSEFSHCDKQRKTHCKLYNGLFSEKRRAKFAISLRAKRANVAIFKQAVSVLVARTRQEPFFKSTLLCDLQPNCASFLLWVIANPQVGFFFFLPPLHLISKLWPNLTPKNSKNSQIYTLKNKTFSISLS